MNNLSEKIDAVAVYGSAVRGDFDVLSDRDLLIVSDDNSALRDAKNQLAREGYSCACYNWRKLSRLSFKKALFIQHLKQEAVIISDRHARLRATLDSYEPDVDYSDEIEATRFLVALTERFTATPKGIGWALDVLSVGFRNLAILTLANEGKYAFSFAQIISGLKSIDRINSDEEQVLVNLRKYKAHYRNNRLSLLPSAKKVFEMQRIIGRIFKIGFTSRGVSKELFNDHCLNSRTARETTQWYFQTRLCEGALLTLSRSQAFLDPELSRRFQVIEDAVTNPSCYNFLFSDSASNLRNELRALTQLTYS